MENNKEVELLSEAIQQMVSEKPYLESLFNAFGPLLLEKSRWISDMRMFRKMFPVDRDRYRDGVPLIQQFRILLPDDPWKSAGLCATAAICQGFPNLAEEMKSLQAKIDDGSLECFSLADLAEEVVDDRLAELAAALCVSTTALQFLQRSLMRFMLTKRARDMAPELASLTWKKGYCPVCGSHPHLAVIRENGQKWLQCPFCSHEWLFPRLTCPYCNHEDPENTNILLVDGNKEESAFLCDKCGKYLPTANRSGGLQRFDPDILAIGLIHLDILAQGKGYQPMVRCEWNTFEKAALDNTQP